MTREDANYYLKSSGFSDEQIDTIAKAYTEPCEDAISRQAAIDALSNLNAISFYEAQEDSKETYYEIRNAIKALPPVNSQQKTGHWIEDEYEMEVRCSVCGEENDMCSKYCPNCGTKMIEPQESEE